MANVVQNRVISWATSAFLLLMSAGAHALDRPSAPKPMPAPTTIKPVKPPQHSERLKASNADKPDWRSKRVDPNKVLSSPFNNIPAGSRENPPEMGTGEEQDVGSGTESAN